MAPALVASWSAIGLGIVLVGVASRLLLRDDRGKLGCTVLLIAGGFVGVGGWGPSFLHDYADLLAAVVGASSDEEKEEAYSRASEAIASGELPISYARATTAYMLENPIPELDGILERSAQAAESPQSKELLERTRTELELKRTTLDRVIDTDAEGLIDTARDPGDATTPRPRRPAELGELDSATLRMLRGRPGLAPRLDKARIDEVLKARELRGP